MGLNKGVQFDDKFLAQSGLDGYMRLPMSNESLELPEELLTAMTNVIEKFRGVGKTDERPIKTLIEMMKKHDALLSQHVDIKTIAQVAL